MKSYIIENSILREYQGKASQPTIPNDITEIDNFAFNSCYTIISIKIPSSVRRIGYRTFAVCKNLTSVEIPNSVKKIDNGAFSDCKSLASIKIPNSVSYIGFYAFHGIKIVKSQYNNGKLRAFKAFNKNWTCRDFKYAVGQSYHQDGKIECCRHGFHACPNPLAVFNYYAGELNKLRFAEVELSGEIDWGYDKVAASDIKIVRKLSLTDLVEIYNSMEKA